MKSAELREAERIWYAKLKETGFKDIEHSEDTPFLYDHHVDITVRVMRGWQSGGQGLFELLTEFVKNKSISSKRSERVYAALYVAGMTPAEISKRFDVTQRSIEKQMYGLIARVKELARNGESTEESDEQAEESGEDESGAS